MTGQAQWQAKMRYMKRAPRFASDLHIEAKTFGSTYACDLIVINVSLTGLLVGGQAEILPFCKNTLLELTIDPEAELFFDPLVCIGKVARIDEFKPSNYDTWLKKIGICITDMDEDHLKPWVNYVSRLAQENGTDDLDEDVEDSATIIEKSFQAKPVYLVRKLRT